MREEVANKLSMHDCTSELNYYAADVRLLAKQSHNVQNMMSIH